MKHYILRMEVRPKGLGHEHIPVEQLIFVEERTISGSSYEDAIINAVQVSPNFILRFLSMEEIEGFPELKE